MGVAKGSPSGQAAFESRFKRHGEACDFVEGKYSRLRGQQRQSWGGLGA